MKNIDLYKHLENKPIKNYLEINQEVYVIPEGNRARYCKNPYDNMEKWIVSKIGKKYFYAKYGEIEKQFELYCGYIKDKSEYAAEYKVFLSKGDYLFEYTCWTMNKRDVDRYIESLKNL